MAKSNLSTDEKKCWVNLRGKLGLTTYQIQNLVRDFGAGGLWPLLVRIGKDLVPYQKDTFDKALLWAIDHKADDHVQPYYHPNECSKVVGSSPTTYTNWALLLLHKMYGTSGIDLLGNVVVQEHVPRCTLTEAVRDELYRRGASGRSECRLISCQMLAFYVGAQVDWASLEGNVKVAPFRRAVEREVRAGGEDKRLQPLQVVYSEKNPKVDAAPVPVSPVVPPTRITPVIPVEKSVVDEIIDLIDVAPAVESAPPPVAAPSTPRVLSERDLGLSDPLEDVQARLAAAKALVAKLEAEEEEVRLQSLKGHYLGAEISGVEVGPKGDLQTITLKFFDGDEIRYGVSLIPPAMDAVV